MSDIQGKLLVAPPNLPDWRFHKTVIYIWKHDVSGASGVIINKKCDNPTFNRVCKDGKIKHNLEINPSIYYGGPILTSLLGCLHSTDYAIPTTNIAKNSVGFTMDKKILEDIAMGKGPKTYLITIGMASWMPGQLEAEFNALPPRSQALSWLVLNYDRNIVFGIKTFTKSENLWEICVQKAIEEKSKEIVDKAFSS